MEDIQTLLLFLDYNLNHVNEKMILLNFDDFR